MTYLEDFHNFGYAKIEGVYTQDECDKIKIDSYQLARDFMEYVQWKGEEPALLFWPMNLSPFMHDIVHKPSLKEIVRNVLGTDQIRQINNQVYFRHSGDEDEFAWHQDICFRTPEAAFKNIEENYVQTVIAVDDIDDNGAIEFIPHSHLLGNLNLIPRDNSERGLRTFVRNDRHGEKVKARAGDVLIWNLLVVHGSEKNVSGRPRMTYMSGFGAEHAVLDLKYPEY